MRTRFFALFLLIMSFSFALSYASEAVELEIKAYKVNHGADSTVEMVITDALTEDLNPISDGKSLDVTSHLSDLLGPSAAITDFGRNVVFSYRVSGTLRGNFDITLSFSPLYYGGENTEATGKLINVFYSLQNENYVFLESSSSVSETGDTISQTSGGNKEGIAGVGIDYYEKLELRTGWTVADSQGSVTGNSPLWIARGAIGMVISRDNENYGYNNVVPGKYIGTVTVMLTYS